MQDLFPTLSNNRYRVTAVLGEGGMATVFLGEDTALQVQRAIKVLHPQFVRHRTILDRFTDEARTMAKLQHPNIVTMHDIGQEENLFYMVMELLQGGNLMDRVTHHGPLSVSKMVQVCDKILVGIGHAHQQGIIHRDIKPENILLSVNGAPKVADFGIARLGSFDHQHTRTGVMMGTLAYMPPEQKVSAKHVTPASDLYAVGVMIYTLLRGEVALDLYSEDIQRVALKGMPDQIQQFLKLACHPDPDERFQTAQDMQAALRTLETVEWTSDEPVSEQLVYPTVFQPAQTHHEMTQLHERWNSVGGKSQSSSQDPQLESLNTIALDDFDFNESTAQASNEQGTSTTNAAATFTFEDLTSFRNGEKQTANVNRQPDLDNPLSTSIAETPAVKKSKKNNLMVAVIGLLILGYAGLRLNTSDTKSLVTESSTDNAIAEKSPLQAPAQQAAKPPVATQPASVGTAPAEAPGPIEIPKTTETPKAKEKPAVPVKKPATAIPETSQTAISSTPKNIRDKIRENARSTIKAKVVITSKPVPKSIFIDGEKQTLKNGKVSTQISLGKHKYRITTKDNRKKTGTIIVRPRKNNRLCWDFNEDSKCPQSF